MRKRRLFIAWIFLIPSLLFYLAFFVYPTIVGLRVSLFEWSGFSENMKFVGFDNFIRLINDNTFLLSLKNTFLILIIGGVGIFLLAFIFSLLLSSGIRGKKAYSSIIFFPYIVAPVVHAIYWGLLVYSPRNGIINQFFKLLKITQLSKFEFINGNHIFWSVLFVLVWIYVGFYLIILMAGIDRIPPYLFESARIEGANEFQLFFKITLPLVKEVVAIAVIFWGIEAIKLFDFLYAFGGIFPPRQIWTTSIYLYLMGFGKREPIFQLGYASAIGVVTLLLVIIVTFLIRKLVKREIYEY